MAVWKGILGGFLAVSACACSSPPPPPAAPPQRTIPANNITPGKPAGLVDIIELARHREDYDPFAKFDVVGLYVADDGWPVFLTNRACGDGNQAKYVGRLTSGCWEERPQAIWVYQGLGVNELRKDAVSWISWK